MTSSVLGDISTEHFLQEYWQQKPLLIRQAITEWPVTLEADELAGLALESDVRSRIVIEHTQPSQWECLHGPFTTETFQRLPASHWCLLVQDVEKILPEFSWLTEQFLFLPRWRIDDLMVSYAAPKGSVGPHVDQYDVFLLQGLGKRRWQIQQQDVDPEKLLSNTELQILQDFNPEEEWVLEPGDMLYLPPGVAHYGIAIDSCMTYSIGFRAPSAAELVQSLAETIAMEPGCNQRYRDQIKHPTQQPGAMDTASLDQIRLLMKQTIDSEELLTKAVCQLLTETSDFLPETSEDATMEMLKKKLSTSSLVQIHPAIKMLYQIKKTGDLDWYLEGVCHAVSKEHAQTIMSLVDQYTLTEKEVNMICQDQKLIDIVFQIYRNGGIIFHE